MRPDNGRVSAPLDPPRQGSEPTPPAATAPFSPTQLAVGFGILASILVIVVGRIRRRVRPGPRGPFGRG